jgi:hypothetical protein
MDCRYPGHKDVIQAVPPVSTITRIDGLFCTILEGSLNLAVLGRRVESVRRPVGVIRPDQKGGSLSGNRSIGQSGVESS